MITRYKKNPCNTGLTLRGSELNLKKGKVGAAAWRERGPWVFLEACIGYRV